MDSFTTLRVLLSRWYVVVPCLLLTAAITIIALRAVPPTFDAQGTLVLLPPATQQVTPDDATEVRVNPWLQMGLDRLANILSQSAASDANAERLKAQGATATFEVTTGTDLDAPGNGSSPVINIVANDADPAVAQQTVAALFAGITAELNQRQQEQQVPEAQLIGAEQITAPDSVSQQVGNKMRAGAVAFALGIALTFGLAFLTESLSEQRRSADRDYTGQLRRVVPTGRSPRPPAVDGRSRASQLPPPQPPPPQPPPPQPAQQSTNWLSASEPAPARRSSSGSRSSRSSSGSRSSSSSRPPSGSRSGSGYNGSASGYPSSSFDAQPYAGQRPPGVSPSHPSWPPMEATSATPPDATRASGGRSSSGGGSRSSRSSSGKSRSGGAGDTDGLSAASSWLSAIDPASDRTPRASPDGRGYTPSTPSSGSPGPATSAWTPNGSGYNGYGGSSSYSSPPPAGSSGYGGSGYGQTPSTPTSSAYGGSGYNNGGAGWSGSASGYPGSGDGSGGAGLDPWGMPYGSGGKQDEEQLGRSGTRSRSGD